FLRAYWPNLEARGYNCSFPSSSSRQKPLSSLSLWASATPSTESGNQSGNRNGVNVSILKEEKAGATVLFEEMKKASNNVGVVVNPVRLNTLTEFGTPEFVADKLIQGEKRKLKLTSLLGNAALV
ncbi:unnamed protein product, partial [Linum tenue]